MKIAHFGGIVECKTTDEFISVLNTRYGGGVNEFWISGEKENPCLALLVNGDYSNLTYFPEDGHPGFQSVGSDTNLNSEEYSVFYTNTPSEEIEVSNSAVIPFSMALQAAKEFFKTGTMPTCIEWFEL